MKRFGSVLFAMLLVNILCFAQGKPKFVEHHSIKKVLVFADDFVDNRFNWIYDQSGLNRIDQGFLFYSNPFEFPYYDGKAIDLDINRDFELDTKIKFISGDVAMFNGLFWGDLIFGQKFFFGFSPLGHFIIQTTSGFETKVLATGTTNYIDRSDFNRLTVTKLDGKYIFSINGHQVYQMPFKPFSGRYFGFGIAPKSYIQIAYLKIWYLEKM